MCKSGYLQDEECHQAASTRQQTSCTGKRQSWGPVVVPGTPPIVASITTSSQGSLSVYCHRLHRLFLVDSGADVSVYPAGVEDRRHSPSSTLTAANGTKIGTYGHRRLDLCFPGLRTHHSFILADVKSPILGADFFMQKGLVIDIPRRRIFSDSVCVRARPAAVLSDLCGLTRDPLPSSRLLPPSPSSPSSSPLTLDKVLDEFPASSDSQRYT